MIADLKDIRDYGKGRFRQASASTGVSVRQGWWPQQTLWSLEKTHAVVVGEDARDGPTGSGRQHNLPPEGLQPHLPGVTTPVASAAPFLAGGGTGPKNGLKPKSILSKMAGALT